MVTKCQVRTYRAHLDTLSMMNSRLWARIPSPALTAGPLSSDNSAVPVIAGGPGSLAGYGPAGIVTRRLGGTVPAGAVNTAGPDRAFRGAFVETWAPPD